jgi:hypothetical protein
MVGNNRDERFTAGHDVLVGGLEQARRSSPDRQTLGGRSTPTARTSRRRGAAEQAVDG